MGQYEEMKDMTNKINAPVNKMLVDSITNIEKELIETKENPRLPEYIFKEHFLDFFKEYGTMTKEDKHKAPLYQKWLELAGSEYGEVDIIDNQGNVLFTTPGLFARPKINFEHTTAVKLNDTAHNSMNRFNRTSAESINYVNNKVAKTMSGILEADNQDELNRWNTIVNKYKEINKDIKPNEVELPKGKVSKVVMEDLGLNYD